MNYYYLGAMLPTLSLDRKAPLSWVEFTDLCRAHLSRGDLAALLQLDQPAAPATHGVVREWREVEHRLRILIAAARAGRARQSPPAASREAAFADPLMEKAVADAFARPDPLARELALDQIRWLQAERLAGLTPFTADAILAYGLKLKILERWAALSAEAGRSVADRIASQSARAQSA